MEDLIYEEDKDKFYKEVLRTQLRPKYKCVHKCSDNLEIFLSQLENDILSVVW